MLTKFGTIFKHKFQHNFLENTRKKCCGYFLAPAKAFSIRLQQWGPSGFFEKFFFCFLLEKNSDRKIFCSKVFFGNFFLSFRNISPESWQVAGGRWELAGDMCLNCLGAISNISNRCFQHERWNEFHFIASPKVFVWSSKSRGDQMKDDVMKNNQTNAGHIFQYIILYKIS